MSKEDLLDALRRPVPDESRVLPVDRKVRRSGRQRTPEATRVGSDEIARIAQEVELPGNVTDVRMTFRHDHGEKLPNGDWSGIGGKTTFGSVWVMNGREESEPIHLFESQKDAFELHRMLTGEEGELWQRKQRRLDAIAAAEAAEMEQETIARTNAKTVARSITVGTGSDRPSRSKEKRSASSGPGMSRRERLRAASKTTS